MKNYRALALLEPEPIARPKKTSALLRVAGLVAVVGVIAWVFSSSEGDGDGEGRGDGGDGGDQPPGPGPAPGDPGGEVRPLEALEVAEVVA